MCHVWAGKRDVAESIGPSSFGKPQGEQQPCTRTQGAGPWQEERRTEREGGRGTMETLRHLLPAGRPPGQSLSGS